MPEIVVVELETVGADRAIKSCAMKFVLLVMTLVAFAFPQAPPQKLVVGCSEKSLINASTTRSDLAKLFGESNLKDAEIAIGEGFKEAGTIVFPNDPKRRLEIVWRNGRGELVAYVRGSSAWSSLSGIRLGTDLRSVEQLNRGPFRLAGFGFDYGGTVTEWKRLPLQIKGNCRFIARFKPTDPHSEEMRRFYVQVQGDRDFSSGHSAMQALNPTVYEIVVLWNLK
jgi:hypothetical protein